jgi:hypothetical protein
MRHVRAEQFFLQGFRRKFSGSFGRAVPGPPAQFAIMISGRVTMR